MNSMCVIRGTADKSRDLSGPRSHQGVPESPKYDLTISGVWMAARNPKLRSLAHLLRTVLFSILQSPCCHVGVRWHLCAQLGQCISG